MQNSYLHSDEIYCFDSYREDWFDSCLFDCEPSTNRVINQKLLLSKEMFIRCIIEAYKLKVGWKEKLVESEA